MAESTPDTARLVEALEEGDAEALDALFPLLYEELRDLARARRREWQGNYTLDTTGLLHEAYLKLAGGRRIRSESRAHFLSLASRAMRQILINYARDRAAQKRGGALERVTLESDRIMPPHDAPFGAQDVETLIVLDEALTRLQRSDRRRGAVVECRFFGGMSLEDTAEALGVSTRTVKRDWAVAQAWLQRELQGAG